MGLIVNKPIIETDFAEICDFLDIDCPQERDVPVLYGGPWIKKGWFCIHLNFTQPSQTNYPQVPIALRDARCD